MPARIVITRPKSSGRVPWIAVDAPNYPVKLEGPGGEGQPGVSYKFMDWDKAPTVEAPPASEVIAYSAVPKKATKGNASGQ